MQTSLAPSVAPYVPMSPRLSSPAHPSSGGGGEGGGGGGGASGGGGRGRGRGEDRRNSGLIGQTVRIVQGPYKGEVILYAGYVFLIPNIFFLFLSLFSFEPLCLKIVVSIEITKVFPMIAVVTCHFPMNNVQLLRLQHQVSDLRFILFSFSLGLMFGVECVPKID